eukprot:6422713-Pyramimonas_sp.AAC.1
MASAALDRHLELGPILALVYYSGFCQSHTLPMDIPIEEIQVYTDATPGGYRYDGNRCQPAWAFCVLALAAMGVSLIGHLAGPLRGWGASDT